MIEFICPNCNGHITVPDKAAGRAGICPKCRSRVVVPGERAGAAPAAPDAAATPTGDNAAAESFTFDLTAPAPEGATPTTRLPRVDAAVPPNAAPRGNTTRQRAVTGNTARNGAVTSDTARNGAVTGNTARQRAVTGNTTRNGAVTGNTARNGAVTGNTARNGAVTGNTARQRAVIGNTTRQRAVTGNTTRQRAVVGGAAGRRRDSSSMIIAGVVAALVAVVGLMAFSSQQAADQARARELAARRQKQEANAQAAQERQQREAEENKRKQVEREMRNAQYQARLKERQRQKEEERSERETRLRQAAQAHAAETERTAAPIEENDEPSAHKQRTLRLLATKHSFDFLDAPLTEVVLEAINQRTGIAFDADELDARKANAAVNLMPRQMAVKDVLMYALRQANANTSHDDDITCFVTNDGIVHVATVGDVEKQRQAANAIFAPKDVSSTAGDPPLEAQVAWHEEQKRKAQAKESAAKAKLQALTLPNSVKLEMVPIKAGQFMMGCPPEEKKTFKIANERYHSVTLTRDFWIGKHEVTQGQWKAIMGKNPSRFNKGDQYPVETVSWNDAKEFCDKLNARFKDDLPAGYRFDLPTEAQWEYACRAGTTTALNNSHQLLLGDEKKLKANARALGEVAWYKKNSGGTTHPVGGKKPNGWGLYDMHGNVWEWCRDPYDPNYDADPEFLRRGNTTMYRTYRGGAGDSQVQDCRSARRAGDFGKGDFNASIGFRLAVVADPD